MKDEITAVKIRGSAKPVSGTIPGKTEKERCIAHRDNVLRLKAIGARYAAFPPTGKKADNNFFDWLGGA